MSVDQGAGPAAPPATPPPPSGPMPAPFASPQPDRPVGAQRRSSWLPRTLAAKIVTGVAVLVVVLLCAIGAVTYTALRSTLNDKLDGQLTSNAGRNTALLGPCLEHLTSDHASCTIPQGPGATHEWFAVLDDSGNPLVSVQPSAYISPLVLSRSEAVHLVNNPGAAITVHDDGHELRVTAGQTRIGAFVVTGLSTDDLHDTLHRLISTELLIGAAALLIAFVATLSGVRWSLRRLKRVTATAQEVSAELSPTGAGLERRVPVTEEGTEVAELATSFNTMLAAVETQFAARVASEQRMRQFLADASHELRTPLTSIRGFAELARMQRAMGGASTDDDNLDRIESEGTRMSRLVDDLLILARGEDTGAHPPERDPVEIVSLLDDVVSSSRAAFPDRPIEMSVDTPPLVLGDRDQLLRVVRNLVTNAAVHTEAGRPIHVRGFGEPGAAVITVSDGGPGLAPEDAAQVFDRFWRADKARTRARGGSGLGMSIVAAIVRAHGGSVRFDSDVETGSVVTVRLPAAPAT